MESAETKIESVPLMNFYHGGHGEHGVPETHLKWFFPLSAISLKTDH